MMKKILPFLFFFLLGKLRVKGQVGKATFYANKFQGRKTASGEVFKQEKLTGASNNFKLGTLLRVTNLFNGKSVVVKVNDRMAKSSQLKGRIVDLSTTAFKKLDVLSKSVLKVNIEVI